MNSIYQLDTTQFTGLDWFVLALLLMSVVWSLIAIIWLVTLGIKREQLESKIKVVKEELANSEWSLSRSRNYLSNSNKERDKLRDRNRELEIENNKLKSLQPKKVNKEDFNKHMPKAPENNVKEIRANPMSKDEVVPHKIGSKTGRNYPSRKKNGGNPDDSQGKAQA